jgi:integrase
MPKPEHRAAILDPVALGGFLRALDGFDGQPVTRAALQLLPLVFTRPGELRLAEWREFDLKAAIWTIPASRTKMRREHKMPLAPQAVLILRDLHTLTGGGLQVFPSLRSPQRHADAPRAAGCQLSGRPVPRQKRRHVDDERVAA